MTKEEYRKASHFRDATKMVAAPGSLSGLFDYSPLFRVCFAQVLKTPFSSGHRTRQTSGIFVST